jgi:multiple sugar transport system permease protein
MEERSHEATRLHTLSRYAGRGQGEGLRLASRERPSPQPSPGVPGAGARRRGQIPLRIAAVLAFIVFCLVAWWSYHSRSRDVADDGRKVIVFWGNSSLGEDIYTALHNFEKKNPEYKVIWGPAVARDLTGDAQRLLSSVAGGVPPDVVWFDRFATGEWASRNALTDLTPYLEAQKTDDPYRIDLNEYFAWAVNEASYAPPGSTEKPRVYAIPTSTDIRVLYVNNDHLQAAGAKPPRTWEELRDLAKKLTRYNEKGQMTRLGFAPNYGNSWLYMYAWQAGGEMLDATRTKVTMSSDPVVRALAFMTDIYDDLGGAAKVNAFQSAFQTGALDPFVSGQVSMKIDGEWYLQTLADWKPDMNFTVVPAPMPADQLEKGREPITWAGGFSLVIPTTSRNKDGAFKLIQFLNSWETTKLLEQGKREQAESLGRFYMPRGQGNRVQYERLLAESIEGNAKIPKNIRQAYAVLKEMYPKTLIRPVTPVGQLLWNQHIAAYEASIDENSRVAGQSTMDRARLALQRAEKPVQRQLDELTKPPPPHVVSWTPYFVLYGVLLVIPFAAIYVTYHRRRRTHGYRTGEVWSAMMFAAPWFIGFAVFTGGPILFSIVMSFTRYDVLNEARYVGLGNYAEVARDPLVYTSLYNTAFMVLRIPITMAIGLCIAMLLNRQIRGIGFYRTAFYMPAIVPVVAASLLWIWLLNPSYGVINTFLNWLFDTFPFQWIESLIGTQIKPPDWLQDANWSKPSLILMSAWGAGAGMIIWLAGLQSIPQQLYEAASIDGAGKWRQFWNVTLPMLSPYILFNLIVGVIGTLQIFNEAYIMTAGGPNNSTLFYAYHLFREAFQYFRMGYASALAWVLFVIVLMLTLLQLYLSTKWVNYDRT